MQMYYFFVLVMLIVAAPAVFARAARRGRLVRGRDYTRARARERPLLDESRRDRLDPRRLPARVRAPGRAHPSAAGREGRHPADRQRDRRGARRGGRDRAGASRTCLRSTTHLSGSRSSSPRTRRADGTDAIVEELGRRERRVRLLPCPRGGKVNAQNLAVRRTIRRDRRVLGRERDLGARRAPPARPQLRRPRRRVRLRPARARGSRTGRTARAPTGATRSGCASRSRCSGSITGGNGAIYALRRNDYVEVDPRFGHDLSLPYLMVQRGRRAVYEREARRVREALARPRGRVPAQGADVRALLADPASGEDARATSSRALSRRARLASRAPLRQRPRCTSACS